MPKQYHKPSRNNSIVCSWSQPVLLLVFLKFQLVSGNKQMNRNNNKWEKGRQNIPSPYFFHEINGHSVGHVQLACPNMIKALASLWPYNLDPTTRRVWGISQQF